MSTHSVVEAKNQLSALIERALKGERVVITRHGLPVVELSPVTEPTRQRTGKDAIEWLQLNRSWSSLADVDGAAQLRRSRDEDWR